MNLTNKEPVRAWLQERHETVMKDLKTLQGRIEELAFLLTELEETKTKANGQSAPVLTRVLTLLQEAGRDGITGAGLAARMKTPKSTASSRLSQLKNKGFARHRDHRYFYVSKRANGHATEEARV